MQPILEVTDSVTQCNQNLGYSLFPKGTDDLEGYGLMDASMTAETILNYHVPRAELRRRTCPAHYINWGNSEARNSDLMGTLIGRKQWEMVPLGQENEMLAPRHAHIRDQ